MVDVRLADVKELVVDRPSNGSRAEAEVVEGKIAADDDVVDNPAAAAAS